MLGYLLSAIVWRQAKIEARFTGALDTLLDMLNDIRLGSILEESKTRGKVKAIYKLEEMSDEEDAIMEALAIKDFHNNRPKLKGVGVYTADRNFSISWGSSLKMRHTHTPWLYAGLVAPYSVTDTPTY